MPSPRTPFIWQGNTGQRMTPQEVERQRLAAALMQQEASDTSPVASPFAGLNRALQGYLSGRDRRIAGDAEQAGMASANQRWEQLSSVLGGGSPAAPGQPPMGGGAAPAMGGGQPASVPQGDVAGYVRSGLVSRGLPEHVADAFLINFQDESGLNPGINEANPIVPGSRGGFGLYQLTGPRRREYEAFASQRGVAPSDIDAQLDFMMQELGGSESRAARNILSAPDTPTAAAAILNDFLRPSEQHRARREARYLGGGGTYTPPSQQNVAAIGGAMGDPWFQQQYGQVANALMGQQMNMQNAAFQQDMQQQDPMYQAQLEMAQLQLRQAQQPQRPAPIEVGGVLLDPVTFQPLFDSRQADQTSLMQNLAAAGLQPGSPEFQAAMIDAVTRPGTQVNVGGEGQRMGTIPPGFAAVQDPSNPSGYRLEPIPGGPAEAELQQAQSQAQMRADQASRYGNVVLEDIGRVREMVGRNPSLTAGPIGGLLANIPGTGAYDTSALLETIRSNIGFDRLQSMREASPTGGALGAVSDFENRQLQSTLGNLNQSQSPEQFVRNLERMQELYTNIIHGPAPSGVSPEQWIRQAWGAAEQQGEEEVNNFNFDAPMPGQVLDGYRYRGGDPASPQSWERVR